MSLVGRERGANDQHSKPNEPKTATIAITMTLCASCNPQSPPKGVSDLHTFLHTNTTVLVYQGMMPCQCGAQEQAYP